MDWLLFIPACFALNLAFGPNNLLAMMHGAQSGVGFAQRAAVGRLLAFVPMIFLSAVGLSVVLTASSFLFQTVKIIGAVYLIWIGISLWRSAKALKTQGLDGQAPSLKRAFRSEALVAFSNPKAILIFAAFFPQFVMVDAYWQSYAQLGMAFLVMEAVAILIYAVMGRVASAYAAEKLPLFQKGSGVTMCVFGVLLLLSPQPVRA